MDDKPRSATRILGLKAAKSTLIYTIGQVVGSAAVLLLLIVLARLLNPSNFGLYAIAVAFYTLLSVGGHFGMGTALRRELPQMLDNHERIRELISNGYFVALCTALIVSIAAILLSNPIALSIYHQASIAGSLRLASSLILLYALFNLTLAILIALDKIVEGTALYLLYAFVQLVAAIALVIAGYGVFGAIVGLGISLVIPSLIGIYWVGKHIGWKFVRPTKKVIRHLMGFSAPVVTSNVAIQGPPNLSILLLGIYTSTIIVGNYNAAYRFGNFVGVFLVSNSFILLPAFAKAFSDRDLSSRIGHIYNSSIYYTLLLLLPFLVFSISVAYPLLYLLFSSKYGIAPLYFAVIALGTTLSVISTYAGNLIIGYGDTKRFMKYQLLAVALQIALLLVLIPVLRANGALLALFVISPIVIDFVYVNALYKQFSFRHELKSLSRIVVPSVLLLALLYMVASTLHMGLISIAINLVATIIIFPPLAVLFGGIRKANIDFIKDLSESFRLGSLASYLIRYTEIFISIKDGRNTSHKRASQ